MEYSTQLSEQFQNMDPLSQKFLRPHFWQRYNESSNLQEMVERFKEREGHYPEHVLADKIYRTRENLRYCKEYNIRMSGPALGRPKKITEYDAKQAHADEYERVEVERRFSLAKRKCGMGLVHAKLRETAAHVLAMSVLVLNLRRIQRTFLLLVALLLGFERHQKRLGFIQ